MSRYPGSVWEPVPYKGLHGRKPYKAAILHTNGGKAAGGDLRNWWTLLATGREGPGNLHIGAQYQVRADGTSSCYVDTDLVVYHAFGASEWAFGIETEDQGHPEIAWTPAQVDEIAAILHFHAVPPKVFPSAAPADGIGYHQQFPEWNQNGHQCPGDVRRVQLVTEVIPALVALYEQEDALTPEDRAWMQTTFLTKADGQTLRNDVGYMRDQIMTAAVLLAGTANASVVAAIKLIGDWTNRWPAAKTTKRP